MKKLLYVIIVVMCFGCSHRGQSSKVMEDTVYIAPDSVWDYTNVDSMDKEIKAYSYKVYGDSNLMEEGLPDSMKLHNQ